MREKKHISSPFSPWNCLCSLGTWWNNILSPEYHLPPWADPHNIFPHPPPSNNSHLILPSNIMGRAVFDSLRSKYHFTILLSLKACPIPILLYTSALLYYYNIYIFWALPIHGDVLWTEYKTFLYRLFLLHKVAKICKKFTEMICKTKA